MKEAHAALYATSLLILIQQLKLSQNPMPIGGRPAPSGMLLGLILYTAWYGPTLLGGGGPMLTGGMFALMLLEGGFGAMFKCPALM